MTPSTQWKEVVGPDEAALFERLAADLGALQQKRAARSGATDRALHAKPNVVAHAELEVLANLPEHLRVGLFAEPRRYPAVVRFSNGGGVPQADRKPDVRGIAVKVIGVGGRKLIPGMEDAPTQDFLAILSSTFPFRTPEEFVWLVVNSASPATFLFKALLHLGPSRTFSLLGALSKGLGVPVPSLAANRYFTALPLRFGDYAARVSFVPVGASASGPTPEDLGAELCTRLASGPLAWDLEVQLYTDEKTTPIEDPTVDWPTPYTKVARLTLPQQAPRGERGTQLAAWAEGLSFDPWHAQEVLRPLGATMRARAAAYRVSNQNRASHPEPGAIPPELVGDR